MGTSVGNGVRRIPRLVLRYQPQTAWRPLFAFGFTTALIALALATCCLIFDLGRIDQAFSLFTHPRPTHLTIGAFALVALLATTGFLALIWGLHFRPVPRPLVRTLQAVALVTAFMVMLYTGLLFQSIGTGLLLGSWLIPVLFVLSSLATGIALLLIAAFLSGTLFGFRSTILRLLRLDLALITTELLAIFALFLLATPTDSVIQTVDALLAGAYALPFWTGFVFCGLALPLTLEAFMQLRQSIAGSLTIFIALSVLVGGYCLRWTLIGAGFPIFAPAVGMGAL
jgi:formate-dependent nitrite reductase membrane component NrfD